jgi:hypothetical protein
MTIWMKKIGRSPIVCAIKTAEGLYIEKALCFARTARPEKAAVVSLRLINEGSSGLAGDFARLVPTHRAESKRWRLHARRARPWYRRRRRRGIQ